MCRSRRLWKKIRLLHRLPHPPPYPSCLPPYLAPRRRSRVGRKDNEEKRNVPLVAHSAWKTLRESVSERRPFEKSLVSARKTLG